MFNLKNKTFQLSIAAVALSVTLAGCSSSAKKADPVSPVSPVSVGIDSRYIWIDSPREVSTVPLVATECVQATSHRNIDSNRADLMARVSLTRQIEVAIQGLQEGYERSLFDQSGNAPTTSTLDEQVVRSIVDRSLVGSYRKRGSYVDREGEGRNFCSMMEVSQDGIEEMLETVAKMNSMEEQSANFTKDQLREMVMSDRMLKRLDEQMEEQKQRNSSR